MKLDIEKIEQEYQSLNSNNFSNDFHTLYHEWMHDLKEVLPTQKYVGNCSKEFCEKLISLYAEKEFQRIQTIDFPGTLEHEIPEKRLYNEVLHLLQKDGSVKTNSVLVKHFHKSLMYANNEDKLSPYNGWQYIKSHQDAFLKFYANRLRCSDWFKEKQNWIFLLQGKVPDFIYGIGLTTSKTYPFVSYFKPALAKYIVKKYLKEYNTVFDPFSGYSGRMLGTLVCRKNYIGQDLCENSVQESRKIFEYFDKVSKELGIHTPSCQLNIQDTISNGGIYECLFTCPPYAIKEQWPGVTPRNYDCDTWIDICLTRYQCERYVFVTDEKIEKYRPYIVETLENTSHFHNNQEYIIVIDKKDLKNIVIDNFSLVHDVYDQIESPTHDAFTIFMTYLYNVFNNKVFDRFVSAPIYFQEWISIIYKQFGQETPYFYTLEPFDKYDLLHFNNQVILGFSAGLDSTYQLLKLKDAGYDVLPYHVRNVNRYENGQSYKAVESICEKLGMNYIVENFKSTQGLYKKQYPENPIKNQLILAHMCEQAKLNKTNKISLGDPFNLPIEDATPGINLTDANEVTEMFLEILKTNIFQGLQFIEMIDYQNKYKEYIYLHEKGMQDEFYSCIGSGRFTQYNHEQDQIKYHVHLDAHNCGTHCRKCATINLLRYYDGKEEFSNEFIEKCWERLWNNGYSSEYFQFNPNIPLEQRIKNLHTT